MLTLQVKETGNQLSPSKTRFVTLVKGLVASDEVRCDSFFAWGQEAAGGDGVRQEKECNGCEANCGQTLDKEKNPPRADGTLDLSNTVCQSSSVGVCQGGARNEDTLAKTDLVLRVEESKVEWNTGT